MHRSDAIAGATEETAEATAVLRHERAFAGGVISA